jgi:hypothetical protein
MGRFYFHIRADGKIVEDPEGLEIAGLGQALDACRDIVRDVLREEKWRDEMPPDGELVIEDELGKTVLVVPFRDLTSP